jgi:DNA-binding winged helix-turn-helix (wHTH) protein
MLIGAGFSVDVERRVVSGADGTPLHLTPKAFDLLCVLLAEAPRVVRKSELHARLWPDTFVSDAALTVLVKELRRVLDDRDREPPLIKTSHGVGFAFDAPVTRRASGAASGEPRGMHWLVSPVRRYVLEPGENVIGRDPAANVWIAEVNVSRRHARIAVSGERAIIEDLESKNGTLLASTPLTAPLELADGDEIQIGGIALIYRRLTTDQSTATR